MPGLREAPGSGRRRAQGVERGRCARAARQSPRANRGEQLQRRFIVATTGAAISAGRDRDLSPPRGPGRRAFRSARAHRAVPARASSATPGADRRRLIVHLCLHSFRFRCLSEPRWPANQRRLRLGLSTVTLQRVASALTKPLEAPRSQPEAPRFYVPELDSLRFFAFFGVFLCHLTHEMGYGDVLSNIGGFGVDLFFTLSAYLITELL